MRNAPATFQRLMHIVLGDVPNCEAYLDNIVVYTESWEDHITTLEMAFERFKRASLTLNLSKCELPMDSKHCYHVAEQLLGCCVWLLVGFILD